MSKGCPLDGMRFPARRLSIFVDKRTTLKGPFRTRDEAVEAGEAFCRRDAMAVGPATAMLCEVILEYRSHPEQGFRACMVILRLVKTFGLERLEAVASRALDIGAKTYGSVKSILDNNLDRQAVSKRAADGQAN